ncbi:cellulose biosynthesis cyclic di-GMP-binding regulatory protein BcsB [Noviherbaspirillum malthae]|uniref:cellulose biosynthesis cyclic di-GMP-binding regulatory protein BcsB n=1 Tax=Noviherbaspirillum malthae TaxID=1260987 RepID=UPI00188E4D78|nr:cellulose biosynthesis cyclic di-GMP-binding regulatory protein BcsB [Noviherbaspirillum malthae]
MSLHLHSVHRVHQTIGFTAVSLLALGSSVALAAPAAVKEGGAQVKDELQLLVKRAPASTATYNVPLGQLANSSGPLTLKGGAPEVAVRLPLPQLVEPISVTLNLTGAASRSLTETSQLVVKVNDLIVDQFGLKGETGAFRRSVTIPASLLKEGDNDIRLVAAQRSHAAQNLCDADTAPELWTQVDMEKSSLQVIGRARPVPARLDAMDGLFDRRALRPRTTVPILTADDPTAEELTAMGIVAQGIGRRYGDVPVTLRHGTFPPTPETLTTEMAGDTRGAVLVGTFDSLAHYFEGMNLPDRPGPVIAVKSLPGDPSRFLLIMAAANEADLKAVASAFSMPGLPWPDEPWMEVRDLELPDVAEAQRMIEMPADPQGVFPLRALQYQTTTFTGKNATETSLRFWNSNWQGRMLVQVHLSYASGMAAQSALNVSANGVLHGSIPLNSTAGGSYFNYAVTVPAGSLKLGWNTLQFQPVLVPDGPATGCKVEAQESLAVTLYDDTTVQKYEGAPSQQSDLALLSGLGRPYIDGKTGISTAVHLGDVDAETVGAGLTLLAKLAQVHQGPLPPAWLGVGDGPQAQHRLWIAAQDKLPPSVRRAHSADGTPVQAMSIPLVETTRVSRADGAEWYTSLRDKMSFTGENRPVYMHASVQASSSPGARSFAYTSRANGITTTVFSADNRRLLASGIESVTAPQQWSQLRGTYASWTPGTASVRTIAAEEAPFQAYGMRGGLAILMSKYPWIGLVMLGLAISLLVPVTALVIRSYRKRNHGPNET